LLPGALVDLVGKFQPNFRLCSAKPMFLLFCPMGTPPRGGYAIAKG
jgi:hypothetical protein